MLDFLLNAAESILLGALCKSNFRVAVEYLQSIYHKYELAVNVVLGSCDNFARMK